MQLTFEWDQKKASTNLRKHGVSFEEAKTVFDDPFCVTVPDPQHSVQESRFVDLGCSAGGRVLVVVYTDREGTIRLISSRQATNSERLTYEESNF